MRRKGDRETTQFLIKQSLGQRGVEMAALNRVKAYIYKYLTEKENWEVEREGKEGESGTKES